MPKTDVRGVPTRWFELGDGPPVVFIHGIPTGPSLWRYVVPLVRRARCLAFEMVGYADSIPAGRGRDISVASQADQVLAWLDDIGIDRAVLVGHDLGGGVAQIVAVRQPERCAGLVLTNSIGYDYWPVPVVRALRAAAPVLRRLPPAAAVYPVLATLAVLGHDDLRVGRRSMEVHWRPYARHDGAEALARQVLSLDAADTVAVADRLPGLDVPARIVWGAADRFLPVEHAERFVSDLDADLVRIDGGKHFVPEDHPEAIADAVVDVLGRA